MRSNDIMGDEFIWLWTVYSMLASAPAYKPHSYAHYCVRWEAEGASGASVAALLLLPNGTVARPISGRISVKIRMQCVGPGN